MKGIDCRNIKQWFGALTTAAILLASGAVFGEEAETRSYILTTATTGGTYYPVGVALATATKVKLAPTHNITMSAISSAGSGENLKLMRENEAQFAILQSLYGAWAWRGEGPLKKTGADKSLRSVTMLWENVEHFVVTKDLVSGDEVSDLKEITRVRPGFSIGKRNSGTEGSGVYILNQLGIDPTKTFDLSYLAYSSSVQALQNGRIQGVNIPAGIPVSAVTRAFATSGDSLKILNFSKEGLRLVNDKYKLWRRYDIPANTYPNQTEVIKTIAQPNFLAVRSDVSEEDVYQIVKVLYDNLPFLSNIHKATKSMDLGKAVDGLPMPLHPGAVRFFKEKGVTVPDYLMPPSA